MISALVCVLFGLSLLPGRKPLCLRFAERISDGIMPEGAERYCRVLTWAWFGLLALLTLSNVAFFVWVRPAVGPRFGWAACLVPTVYAAVVIPLAFAVEKHIRNRCFQVVFRTSGSTGTSKVIVKNFETLAREVALHRRHYRTAGVTSGTVFLGTVQWHHMYGKLWMDLLPKAMGLPADPEVIMTPEALIARMSAAERVFLITTPSFLDRFTAYADQYEVPRNCVEIITSGALLTKEVSDRAERVFGLRPRQIFGSTETGGVAWRRDDGDWRVFDEVKASVRDGRLRVRSPFSFRRTYLMGDGVELAADGRSFRLLGRRDRLVKINEERVNLAEMEERVRAMGYRDCALVKLAGEHGDYLGLVLVDDTAGKAKNALELRREFVQVFPTGTVPRKYRVVAELPRNPQGKVLTNEIAKMF